MDNDVELINPRTGEKMTADHYKLRELGLPEGFILLEDYRPVVVTDSDIYYLKSILDNLHDLRSVADQGRIGQVSALGGEALADNIDWLDCYIDRLEKSPRS